tara:strand:+ start:303 stop:446 length:144 start_codon:yes stop_codon:yes gene_type:complete
MRLFLFLFLIIILTSCGNIKKSKHGISNEKQKEIPMNVTMETTIKIN